jgi:hypothetical protein
MIQSSLSPIYRQRPAGAERGAIAAHLVVLIVLGLLCFGAVSLFYYLADSRFSTTQIKKSGPVDTTFGAAADPERRGSAEDMIQAVDDKEAITRRNVFLSRSKQNRRGTGDDLLESAPPSSLDLVLIGTVMDSGGSGRAVIYDLEDKKQHLLREGDVIKGASLRQIMPGRVIISRQGNNEMLDIAEAVKLRTAMNTVPFPDQNQQGEADVARQQLVEQLTGAVLGQDSAPASREDGSSSEQTGLRVDLNRLGESGMGVNVKGRIAGEKNE